MDPALVAADGERFTVELALGARAAALLYAKPGEVFPALPYGTGVDFAAGAPTARQPNLS